MGHDGANNENEPLTDGLAPESDSTADTAAADEVQPVAEPVNAEASKTDEAAKESPSRPSVATSGGGSVEATREGMQWYVLRVASNKEERVSETLRRKVRIEGLDERVGRILVPTAKEKRMKAGQVKVYERKLYPGYVFVEMATESDGSIPEDVWFLVKETTGVGDFIGSDGKPTSMREHDVEMMLLAAAKPDEEATLQGLEFSKGDRVKIKEGSFQNFEGDVETVDEAKGVITVLLTIFGRSTPVDVEYWQLEKL